MKSRLIYLGFGSDLFFCFFFVILAHSPHFFIKGGVCFYLYFFVFPPYTLCSVGEVSEILFVFSFCKFHVFKFLDEPAFISIPLSSSGTHDFCSYIVGRNLSPMCSQSFLYFSRAAAQT